METSNVVRTGSATRASFWLDDNGERHYLPQHAIDAWVEENTLVYGCMTREESEEIRALYDFD